MTVLRDTKTGPLKVMLAEDMHMVRAALAALIALEDDLEVVAQVATGKDVLSMIAVHSPDVAVLDLDLPIVDGLTAAARIREDFPDVAVLILTALGRPGTLRKALAIGVQGFILKDAPPEELVRAIRAVASGQRHVDWQLAASAWDQWECPLTQRELESLEKASEGLTVDEIAVALRLTSGTVRNYLTSTVTKLNARNRLDAVRIARELGWF